MPPKRFLIAGAFALAAAAASPAAFAQACAGFTDVSSASGFCPNVEWLKNRSITLGCTTTTLYCPSDAVTRLSMAAFMNRLGTALTPTFLRKREPSLGGLNFSTVQTVCMSEGPPGSPPGTTQYAVTGFPRTAIVTALLNAFTPDGGFDLQAQIVYSTDNGTSWLPVPAGDGFAYGSLHAGFSPPFDISLRPYTFIDLDVGTSYRFAVQGLRTAGTSGVANAYCEIHIQIVNRNGTGSPFDEPVDPRPPGRAE